MLEAGRAGVNRGNGGVPRMMYQTMVPVKPCTGEQRVTAKAAEIAVYFAYGREADAPIAMPNALC
jgi:hypothetical protein